MRNYKKDVIYLFVRIEHISLKIEESCQMAFCPSNSNLLKHILKSTIGIGEECIVQNSRPVCPLNILEYRNYYDLLYQLSICHLYLHYLDVN